MTYGYIRVSSRDQNLDRQQIAMEQFGVEDGRVYADKQSGFRPSGLPAPAGKAEAGRHPCAQEHRSAGTKL